MLIKHRLDALTSMRFFAAGLIVIHHCFDLNLFGLSKESYPTINLSQAVSFFFVLSGFILAYVYPTLDTWPAIKKYWRARIARIWPALLASFVIALWLLPLNWEYKTGLANLLMINAWIPFPIYFFSYNSPSWSISTEFFFYLAFPFLIYQWNKTWLIKLLVSASIVLTVILLSNWLQLPSYVSMSDEAITSFALLYIHPFTRIFEFIFGIFVASYWRIKLASIQWSMSRATLYEIGAILLAGSSMHYLPRVAQWVGSDSSTFVWLSQCGSVLFFGLLIYVIAMGRGRISVWLSHPILILLGEISFSLYLLHQILLRYYKMNITAFPHWPYQLSFITFWTILLLASYLMWALIEMPGRRLLLGKGQKQLHGTKAMQQSWRSHFNLNRKTISAVIILTGLLTTIYFSMGKINRISQYDADVLTPKQLQSVVGAQFGGLFALLGIKIVRDSNGLTINLAWESLVKQNLAYSNAIHLTDVNGKILTQADYKQPMHRLRIDQGTIWKDTIIIPARKLSGKESVLALALYPHNQPRQLLMVDRGDRDWGNRRLLIRLNSIVNPMVSGAVE